MPTVATSPEIRTHSCDFAYFKSEGTFDMAILSQGVAARSIRFSINWFGHRNGQRALTADFDCKLRLGFRKFRRHVAHADPDAKRRTLCAADHLAQSRSRRGTHHGIMRPRRG